MRLRPQQYYEFLPDYLNRHPNLRIHLKFLVCWHPKVRSARQPHPKLFLQQLRLLLLFHRLLLELLRLLFLVRLG